MSWVGAVLKSGVSWRHLLYAVLHMPWAVFAFARRGDVLVVRLGGVHVPAVALGLPRVRAGTTASSCTATRRTRSISTRPFELAVTAALGLALVLVTPVDRPRA